MSDFLRIEKLAGLLLVVALHGVVLYGAWSYRLLPPPQETVTLFVNLINPPPPPVQKKPEPPPPLPPPKVKLVKPRPVTAPPQPVLAANAPVISAEEPVAPPPPPDPVPVVEAPPAPPALAPVAAVPEPPAPVVLSSDLAVACPQRTAPEYPATSRRYNEQGRVLLRVELDETGRVVSARVKESSGFKRLDEAGVAAVKTWHCNAPVRDGQAVKAIALQPFNFVLEGRK